MRVINRLEDARAALNEGVDHLAAPAFGACHAGVNYYRHLVDALAAEFPDVDFTFTLCCGDDAAIAHDALRLGFLSVLCDCPDAQLQALQAMATAMGAQIARHA